MLSAQDKKKKKYTENSDETKVLVTIQLKTTMSLF